ncbi:hypothetical protein GDO81_019300 [Engystomops pustulosus]|uniref:Secreted protein n=1 Tax=Engystomops pustulosus TaxID=76066 RepID=A0AAV6ZKK7_ENGPU|nr:hypothetical protein GDO81_019300 [Engystomops pustulosus]
MFSLFILPFVFFNRNSDGSVSLALIAIPDTTHGQGGRCTFLTLGNPCDAPFIVHCGYVTDVGGHRAGSVVLFKPRSVGDFDILWTSHAYWIITRS